MATKDTKNDRPTFDFAAPTAPPAPRLNPFATDADSPEAKVAAKAIYETGLRMDAHRKGVFRLQGLVRERLARWWKDGEPASDFYSHEVEVLTQLLADYDRTSAGIPGDVMHRLRRGEQNPWTVDLNEWDNACRFVRSVEGSLRTANDNTAGRPQPSPLTSAQKEAA